MKSHASFEVVSGMMIHLLRFLCFFFAKSFFLLSSSVMLTLNEGESFLERGSSEKEVRSNGA